MVYLKIAGFPLQGVWSYTWNIPKPLHSRISCSWAWPTRHRIHLRCFTSPQTPWRERMLPQRLNGHCSRRLRYTLSIGLFSLWRGRPLWRTAHGLWLPVHAVRPANNAVQRRKSITLGKLQSMMLKHLNHIHPNNELTIQFYTYMYTYIYIYIYVHIYMYVCTHIFFGGPLKATFGSDPDPTFLR